MYQVFSIHLRLLNATSASTQKNMVSYTDHKKSRKKRVGESSTKKYLNNKKKIQQQLSAGYTAGIWKGDVI